MISPAPAGDPQKLKRRLSLTLVVLYGLGVTIGAGIYVLIGETAAKAGQYAPVSFVLAAVVMGFSAATFSEFVGRLPVSAGEAAYVRSGFRSQTMALVVGLVVMLAGIVSSATISLGSAGYLGQFLDPVFNIDRAFLTVIIIVAVAAIACIGILESVAFAGVMTLIEISGLAAIVIGGLGGSLDIAARLPEVIPSNLDIAVWSGILSAGLLAFFAFIGFEDMVNVAEEVRKPEQTMPRAIFITLLLAAALYFVVASVAVLSVPLEELAGTDAPLGLVFGAVTDLPPGLVGGVAIIATFNGIVIQVIMASRVLYGLADQGTIPGAAGRVLGYVYGRTGTPVVATVIVAGLVAFLALSFEIARLAGVTSQLILAVFILVNLALIRLKLRERFGNDAKPSIQVFQVPIAVPIMGALLSGLLLAFGG